MTETISLLGSTTVDVI